MQLEVLETPGLGDNSYVVASEGLALVVDPQRDIGRYLAAAAAAKATITHVLETHVHNDYLSGALELRASTGAEIVAPAGGGYEFGHRSVGEGDTVELGRVRLVAIQTPGHTREHLAYLLYREGSDAPAAVFTGGSLMVGGAGRTDLLGEESTDRLTRVQYRTLRRLAALADTVEVLPTHGAGSFCGAGAPTRTERTSTMAQERRLNPALSAPDEEAFVREQLSELLSYPSYYAHMAPINRAGPRVFGGGGAPRPPGLTPADVEARLRAGIPLVDGRWRVQFARAHVMGSINVELDDSFGSYVGWVAPFGEPVVLVLPESEEDALDQAAAQLFRIGYERIEGYLRGGIEAWRGTGRPVASYGVAGLEHLCRASKAGGVAHILDVRQEVEWDGGHIAGSQHVFVGDLPGRLQEIPRDAQVWTICRTGHRSSIAASLLDREGIDVRLVDGTGVEDFLKHCAPEAREPAGPAVKSEGT